MALVFLTLMLIALPAVDGFTLMHIGLFDRSSQIAYAQSLKANLAIVQNRLPGRLFLTQNKLLPAPPQPNKNILHLPLPPKPYSPRRPPHGRRHVKPQSRLLSNPYVPPILPLIHPTQPFHTLRFPLNERTRTTPILKKNLPAPSPPLNLPNLPRRSRP